MMARKVFLFVILLLSLPPVFAQAKNSQLTIKIKDGVYIVSGVLSSEDVKNEILKKLTGALGANVRADLLVSPGVTGFGAEWKTEFDKTLAAIRPLRSGLISFSSPPGTDRISPDIMETEILLLGEKAAITLDDFGGKPVVLFLIEYWCGPCVLPADYLNDLYPYLKEHGIEVVGLSGETSDEEKKNLRYLARRKKYKFKLGWIDPKVYSQLMSISRFNAIPQVYLISGNKLHGIFMGGGLKANAAMKKAIEDNWINKLSK